MRSTIALMIWGGFIVGLAAANEIGVVHIEKELLGRGGDLLPRVVSTSTNLQVCFLGFFFLDFVVS